MRCGKAETEFTAAALCLANNVHRFAGSTQRPDLEALAASGLVEQVLGILVAFEQGGVENVENTSVGIILHSLGSLKASQSHPSCVAALRRIGSSIAFAMEHSLAFCESLGYTTGASAVTLCCRCFGRDEAGTTGFSFTEQHVEQLLTRWSDVLTGTGYSAYLVKPSAESILVTPPRNNSSSSCNLANIFT